MSEKIGRVLVVDDEDAIREVLARVCEELNFEVFRAGDGESALETLRTQPLEIVLLDVFLPGINGFQVLERVRAEPLEPNPGFIVLTSADETESQAQATALGAIDFIPKPFRLDDLERRVLRALSVIDLERKLVEAEAALAAMRGRDPTTGVGATSELFEALEAEFQAARGGDQPLACVVFSDEGYDRALRARGVDAGAERLQTLSRAVEAFLAEGARVFRVDAAELVVLMPGIDRSGARAYSQRVQEGLAEVAAYGGLQPVEVSVAAAVYPHPEIQQASQLFRAVNVSLARARSNQTSVFFQGF